MSTMSSQFVQRRARVNAASIIPRSHFGQEEPRAAEKLPQLQIRQWLSRANIVDVIATVVFFLCTVTLSKREKSTGLMLIH